MLMARSGADILNSLFTNAIILNLVPSAFERGRIGLQYAVLTAEFIAWETVLDNYKKEGILQTAVLTDDILKLSEPLHYQTPATPSSVMVHFYWDPKAEDINKSDTVIPFGQTVQTMDSNPIVFTTTERAVLYADVEYVQVRAKSTTTGSVTMIPSDYIDVIMPNLSNANIMVINPLESWGGADAEDPLMVRTRALGARYAYEKGTAGSIDLELLQFGLASYQYSLIDNAYGYGSFALYIDTTSDELIADIKGLINQIKALGIYSTIDKILNFDFEFDFNIKIMGVGNIVPEERNNLKNDLTSALIEFVKLNGVGKTIMISHLVHYLLDQLMDKYSLFDLHIDTNSYMDRIDKNGNIIVNPNEKMNITAINIAYVLE
jgi:hypothetical protein